MNTTTPDTQTTVLDAEPITAPRCIRVTRALFTECSWPMHWSELVARVAAGDPDVVAADPLAHSMFPDMPPAVLPDDHPKHNVSLLARQQYDSELNTAYLREGNGQQCGMAVLYRQFW